MPSENSKRAVQLYNSRHLCSQAILKTYAEKCGISEEQAMKLGSGFGAGMRKGEVCGACTGALMVLGLLYGQTDPADPDQRKDIYALSDRFLSEFSARSGSYICNEILKCDVSTAEGMQYARDAHLFTEVCPEMVMHAADVLDEILDSVPGHQ